MLIDAGVTLLLLVCILCTGDPTSAALCTRDAWDRHTLSVLHLARVHGACAFPRCVQHALQLQPCCTTSGSICAESTIAARWAIANSVRSIAPLQYAGLMALPLPLPTKTKKRYVYPKT